MCGLFIATFRFLLTAPGRRSRARCCGDSAPGPIYICERHYRQLPRIRRMLQLAGVDPDRCVFLTDEPVTGPEHLVDRLLRLGTRTPTGIQLTEYPVPDLPPR